MQIMKKVFSVIIRYNNKAISTDPRSQWDDNRRAANWEHFQNGDVCLTINIYYAL